MIDKFNIIAQSKKYDKSEMSDARETLRAAFEKKYAPCSLIKFVAELDRYAPISYPCADWVQGACDEQNVRWVTWQAAYTDAVSACANACSNVAGNFGDSDAIAACEQCADACSALAP